MRQGSAGASTPASSSVPSKATSEAGLETTSEEGLVSPLEGTPNKDKSKLTREEREAQYKAARERIFGDFQESVTSESASTGENSASMSRSSSSSGKRKTRKQKTPKDDSFEARSAYIPSYAPLHMSNMQPQYQPHYSDPTYQGSFQAPTNGYGANMNYGSTPTQAYPGFDSSMPFTNVNLGYGPNTGNQQPFSPADSWSSMQSPSPNEYFNYPTSPAAYPQTIAPMVGPLNNQYIPHSGMQQQQNWINNQYQGPYPRTQNQANQNGNGWSGYQPTQQINNPASYAYGQIPVQNFGGNANQAYNAQYSGSNTYSRSLFNPQTRSFVPSNATSRNGGRNNSGRKKNSPSSSQHQSRNNSIAAASRSFTSETSGTPPPRTFEKGAGNNLTSSQRGPIKEDSLQQKYGAPAHLPKKPPPSQVLSSYEVDGVSQVTPSHGAGRGSPISYAESGPGAGPSMSNESSA